MKVLIFGVCGQDGSLLAEALFSLGEYVVGLGRDKNPQIQSRPQSQSICRAI